MPSIWFLVIFSSCVWATVSPRTAASSGWKLVCVVAVLSPCFRHFSLGTRVVQFFYERILIMPCQDVPASPPSVFVVRPQNWSCSSFCALFGALSICEILSNEVYLI